MSKGNKMESDNVTCKYSNGMESIVYYYVRNND